MPRETFFNLPEDKRAKIIAVALEEFAQKGFDKASITSICALADIAKGSFYQYFTDKTDLFLFLLGLVGQKKLEFISSRVTVDWSDFFGSYRDMVLVGAEFSIVNPLYNEFATRCLDAGVRDESAAEMKRMTAEFFLGLVRQAQERGQIRADVPTDLIVLFLNALSVDFGKYVLAQAGVELSTFTSPESQARLKSIDLPGMTDDLIKLLRSGIGQPK